MFSGFSAKATWATFQLLGRGENRRFKQVCWLFFFFFLLSTFGPSVAAFKISIENLEF